MKTPLRPANCGIAAVLHTCLRVFAIPALLFFISCTNDTYDKGDGEYSLLEAQMAEIHIDKDLSADYLTTDDGEQMHITTPFTSSWMKTPDSTYRAMTYFTRTNSGVDVTATSRVAVAVPKEIKDLKTDPLKFESAWVSPTGNYINLSVYLMLGTTNDENAIQALGCHKDTLRHNADGTSTRLLTLYHDQGGVPQYYSQRTFISVPVTGINADSVCLTIYTYDGILTKTFAHKN